jgi:hypothetical protein
MKGNGEAQKIAIGEEYDWNPEWVRGALADSLVVPYLDEVADATGKWEILDTEGGTDRWKIVVRGISEKSAAEILAQFDQTLAARGKWTSVKAASAGSTTATRGSWRFNGPDGKPWSGTVSVEPVEGKGHQYLVKLDITRAS